MSYSIYRLYDVGSLEEPIFPSIPESQVAPPVRYQEIIVQRMKRRARQIFLHRLNTPNATRDSYREYSRYGRVIRLCATQG